MIPNTEKLEQLISEAAEADKVLVANNARLQQANETLEERLAKNPYVYRYGVTKSRDTLDHRAELTLKDPSVNAATKQMVSAALSNRTALKRTQAPLIETFETVNKALVLEVARLGPLVQDYAVKRHTAIYQEAIAAVLPFAGDMDEAKEVARNMSKCRLIESLCFRWSLSARSGGSAVKQARMILEMLIKPKEPGKPEPS